jgi:hypothetical protein
MESALADVSVFTLITSVALAIGLSASAGLRAWLPLLVTGALARAGFVHVGDAFAWLGSTPALIVFGTATVLELLGDKIPFVDHTLDAASTFVRPAAGVLLAASVMWQIDSPMMALVLGLIVGAPAAAVPHVVKSGTRAASTFATGGFANPIISLVEDVIAAAMVMLSVVLPILAAALVGLVAFVAVRKIRTRTLPGT